MIEEEAKTKWCPFARFVFGVMDYPAGNRFDGSSDSAASGADQCRCMASACMAWRWANDYERRWDLPRNKAPEGEGWDHVEAVGGVAHWVRKLDTPHGFYGLAGSPR